MSTNSLRIFLAVALLMAGGIRSASGFVLLGERIDWQTPSTGFDDGDIGGPMILGEEYRWNIPVINYAFDESFLNYFGQRGVDEVEKAVQILSALPSMSQLDINQYPMHSQRVNYRAQAMNLLDLKSVALSVMLEELGLGNPNRFVFTLRSRWVVGTPPVTNYFVIKRNYDPETWEHTSYINGQLWTYDFIFDNDDANPQHFTVNNPVDPLILAEPVAAGIGALAFSRFGFGTFYTGLTRDDVGGLRYIYRRDNFNVENLPPNTTIATFFAGGGGGGGSPWAPVIPTNIITDTNLIVVSTNVTALRPGIDRLNFRRVNFDSLFGPFVTITNFYQDSYVSNNTVFRQSVERVLVLPDLVFGAEELVEEGDAADVFVYLARTEAFINNDDINGITDLDGPGEIQPTVEITFSKVGPIFFNFQSGASRFLVEPALPLFLWGSFDGTTNDPVIYPFGTSIRQVENQVLRRR